VTHDVEQGYKLGSKMAIYDSGRIVQFDHKDNIITFPANRTAARLVGFKNLYKGIVTEITEKYTMVKMTDLLQNLKVANVNAMKLSISQNVIVGIRPENVRLVERPGENTIACTIDQIVQGIATTNYRLHINIDSTVKHFLECVLLKSDIPVITNDQFCHAFLQPENLVIITG
jgi:ABC-type Fe3+/spermidine/putrescine transport system ATPase subunit